MMHESHRWMVFRSAAQPVSPLPLNVRSVGRFAVKPGWHELPRKKWCSQLFWICQGEGQFLVGEKWQTVKMGEIFFYYPGEVHEQRAADRDWVFCWITFDHPDSEKWLEGFGFGGRVHRAGTCPEKLFRQIAVALKDCTPQGERRAAHGAHALLLEASAAPAVDAGSLASRARQLLDRRFSQPAWGISDLAVELEVHRSTLFRQFLSCYGLTPSHYLQNLRVQKAVSLLQHSTLQIQEIAWQSGFSDQNYFSRAVRKHVGLSPREFRGR